MYQTKCTNEHIVFPPSETAIIALTIRRRMLTEGISFHVRNIFILKPSSSTEYLNGEH